MSSEGPTGVEGDTKDIESPTTEEELTVVEHSKDETEESASDLEDPVADPLLQAGLAEASLSPAAALYESSTLVQAPKLEVIAEHEILETPAPAPALASPAAGDANDQEVASFLDNSKPVFSIVDEFGDDRSLTPLSRHDSYSMSYSRQDSLAGGAYGVPTEQDSSHPLLRPIARHQMSEPTIPKSYSESQGFAWLRTMGNFMGRHLFGSTAVTPSESLQSLEFGPQMHGQRIMRRPFSSRNSVSSDIQTVPSSRASSIKGFSLRGTNPPRPRITAPTSGQPVSRSKRYLTKGTAGFLHAKGTSAISLRPPDTLQGLPLPCGECPHCRKFLRLGEAIPPLPLGRACPCRICTILSENQPGAPPLLKLQAATRKNKEPGGIGVSTQSHSHSRFTSDFGIFCEHCNQSGYDSRCLKLAASAGLNGNGSSNPVQPVVLVQSPPATSPADNASEATSLESLFVPGVRAPSISRDMGVQVSHMSLCSSVSNLSTGPFCRICHGSADKEEQLMSPCRCCGSLRCVHQSCLVHWLEISCRKLRKPPVCELCGYRYQRHKIFKFRNLVLPRVSRRDKMLHIIFVLGILTMLISAGATIVCFQLENDPGYKKTTRGQGSLKVELTAIEVVTLVAGVMFFVGFFVAMYVEVKAQTTLYKLITRCWALNQEWRIDEYNLERDQAYCKKLEAVRARLSAIHTPPHDGGLEDDISDRMSVSARSNSPTMSHSPDPEDVENMENLRLELGSSRKSSDTTANGSVMVPPV